MKKLLLFSILSVMGLGARAVPFKVQGVPYRAAGYEEPGTIPSPSDFDFSTVESWAGEGENKCYVVIQWAAEAQENALVFGYRWDGTGTGIDALEAIARSHPQLYVATEGGTQYGSTISGIGWDPDGDGGFAIVKDGTTEYPDEDGIFAMSGYSYDGYEPLHPDDWWHGGWYDGYWSYWGGHVDDDSFSYSQVGASGRVLEDGCIDGWMFAPALETGTWKTWVAAPAPTVNPGPEPDPDPEPDPEPGDDELAVGDVFETGGLRLRITALGDAPEAIVTFKPSVEGREYDYTGNRMIYVGTVTVPETIEYGKYVFTITGVGEHALYESYVEKVVLPASVATIGDYAFSYCEKLTEINIPAAVTELGREAFSYCPALTTVTGMENVATVGRCCFMNDSILKNLSGLTKAEVFDNFAFASCGSLETVPVSPVLRYVGHSAFGNTAITDLVLPATVENFGEVFGMHNEAGVKVWWCASEPIDVLGVYNFATSWDYSTGTPVVDYAPIYVPYGCSSAFRRDVPWENSEIRELHPVAVLAGHDVEVDGHSAKFTGVLQVAGIVEENVPELFLASNDFWTHYGKVAGSMKLEYHRVDTPETVLTLAAAANDDGDAEAAVSGLAPGEYRYRWTSAMEHQAVASEWTPFVIEAADQPVPSDVATFNFIDASTLSGVPGDEEWYYDDSRNIFKAWNCDNGEFNDNGTVLRLENGSWASTNHTRLRKEVDNPSAGKLMLYGNFTLVAPAGKCFTSIGIASSKFVSDKTKYIALDSGQKGTLECPVESRADYTALWTADVADRVNQVKFVNSRKYGYMELKGIDAVLADIPSGITDVESADGAEPVYYTLQGVRVDNPTPGIYIERRGESVRKVVVR